MPPAASTFFEVQQYSRLIRVARNTIPSPTMEITATTRG